MVTAHMVIDYQNLHNTAHEQFESYGTPIYDALVHPGLFADEVATRWEAETGDSLVMSQISVFRGLPDPRREAKLNRIMSRQRLAWQSDARVSVRTRTLRYPDHWPEVPAEEKGIDVMVALALVTAAIANKTDLFMLVSRDTDLLPAIELAQRIRPEKLAIATWSGSSILRPKIPVPTVQLGRTEYERCRDVGVYDY